MFRLRSAGILFVLLWSPLSWSLPATNPVAVTVSGNPQQWQAQRQLFLDAEQALRTGERMRYWQALKQLRDYPLYPYLRYKDLNQRLAQVKTDELDSFLSAFADSPVSDRLRYRYLNHLAKQRQWRRYQHYYRDNLGERHQCLHAQSLLHTKEYKRLNRLVDSLWLSGHSLPKECDTVIQYWHRQGQLDAARVWQRIELSFARGNWRLAKYLGRYLNERDRRLLQQWISFHRQPQSIVKHGSSQGFDRLPQPIQAKLIKRLARFHPQLAADHWPDMAKRLPWPAEQKHEIDRAIGLALAFNGDQAALSWLSHLPPDDANETVHEWRIRAALAQQDWQAVLHWLDALPEKMQAQRRWRYWRARALEQTGQQTEAQAIYRALAKSRSYEGFLAADRLGQPYEFDHQPLPQFDDSLARLSQHPGIARAHELYHLDRRLDARREWYRVLPELSTDQLQQAAVLAHQWGWHDTAIATLGRTRFRDDLELRFPLAFAQEVHRFAQRTRIDPAWAFAVIRQESAFRADARSHKNARGLMQLMPQTAREVAREIRIRQPRQHDLHQVDLNLRLGMTYLRGIFEQLQQNPVLATAAYNAGPHRVSRWLPKGGPLESDIWIETIPFRETRNYLRNVMAFTAVYEQRMGKEPTPLSQRMPAVLPKTAQ